LFLHLFISKKNNHEYRNTIIAHLDNKGQENIFKTILKLLKIKFEIHKKRNLMIQNFIKKVLKSKYEFQIG
jgi:hypothetical protein